jgi:hypothetical protein
MIIIYLDRKKFAPSLTKSLISDTSPSEKDGGVEDVKMTQLGSDKSELVFESTASTTPDPDTEKPKRPSKDSRTRWLFLIIYLAISVPLMIISIALIAAL